jgi:hypothetical protein
LPIEHSPLPWRVVNVAVGQWSVFCADENPWSRAVVNLHSGRPVQEREANAEFIARACNSHDELTAALSAVLAAYEHRVGDGLTPLILNARAALARAEGRTE